MRTATLSVVIDFMSLLRVNVLSNLVGQGVVAILSLLVVPWYIAYMGVESYALVGVYASLQAMFAVLDMGLSQTLGREMALHSGRTKETSDLLNIACTLEGIYALGAGLVFVCIAAGADFLAYHWLNPIELSAATVAEVIWIVGLVVALRWPLALYTGGLYGLQRQLLLNALLVGFTVLQTVGALGVLALLSPTVEVFFVWQAVVAVVQVLVTRWVFWRCLPEGRGRFSLAAVRHIWRFALGMTAISLLSTILTQLDKVVLSRFVDLKVFGYYVLASTAAAVLYKLGYPIFNAFLPKLTQLNALDDKHSLRNTYRLGCQLLSLMIMPCAMLLAFYAEPVLALWTGNHELVENTKLIFSLIVIGNAFNTLMSMPYALQLAHAWTRLSIIQNILSVIVFVPMIYYLVRGYGVVGAAGAWILLNVLSMAGGLWAMHQRLLPCEQAQWYRNTLFAPLLGGGIALAMSASLPNPGMGWAAWPLAVAAVWVALAVALTLGEIRSRLFRLCSAWWMKIRMS